MPLNRRATVTLTFVYALRTNAKNFFHYFLGCFVDLGFETEFALHKLFSKILVTLLKFRKLKQIEISVLVPSSVHPPAFYCVGSLALAVFFLICFLTRILTPIFTYEP